MRLLAGQPVRPYKLKDVTVGNAFPIKFTSMNLDRTEPETASSGRYRIDNLTNLVVVREWTSFTPTNPVSITIPASVNVMSYQGVDQQTNQVSVELTYADARKSLDVRVYRLSQVYNVMGNGVVP